jgi:hypothetical protein
MDYCSWLSNSRLWIPAKPCSISNVIDFSVWANLGANPETTSANTQSYDLTVINVMNLTSWAGNDQGRSFRIVDVNPSASLSNAVFVVNVTIDMSNPALANIT